MAAPAPYTPGHSRILKLAARSLALAALFLGAHPPLHAAKWEPIPAAELASDKPTIDPEAGAEILFRETVIMHNLVEEFERRHFVRAKIYSERGLQDFLKIDLPYDQKTKIRDIAVRTTKPDGQIIELEKKDIYDREIIKLGKERVKAKSFSPAGLQPGAIVEYAYTEITEGWSWYVPMYFQSNLPARLVRYKFQPVDLSGMYTTRETQLTARVLSFNCAPQPLKPDKNGFFVFELANVAAAREEPYQPPRLNSESSRIVCYSLQKQLPPTQYWAKQGKELHERMLKETKATKVVQTTLANIVTPTDTPDQKLRKLYDFTRTKLLNRASPLAGFTNAQRAKFKPNETATDTLNTGHGTAEDLNAAFVALARAAGLDARYAAAGDRAFLSFDANITEPFMTSDLIAAVQLEGQWQFFDPGVLYLPYAVPHWRNSDTGVLIAAPKDATLIAISVSAPAASPIKRKAFLTLDADGTLEGTVTLEYDGHHAHARKWDLHDKGTAELEEYVRDLIREHLKLAELSDIKVENASNPLAPLKISFRLRVPEYADRTGSRLFVQPALFQKNLPLLLTEKTRRTPLAFDFTYTTTDDIRITPPEGYELEQASAPPSFDLGALGSYAATLGVAKDTGALVFRRNFTRKAIAIPTQYYDAVRDALEAIHARDAHTVTFRRKPTADTPPTVSNTPAPAAPPAPASP
ncbi:hypothetical protein CMV30_03030 [Nibricoccus aquaticus]|uniref:Transglutaminase-like domain-containing protein n=1 Tax=Nibricoccus aquaticus TaxID=2576891 RepID=A0A290Q2X5_9BACT|nr:DUF3857 domain-containing protein [Nibricoccus aquaticus]ATC63019.1 hypothetical protein CMV30_03030 [Nibricoccus aquaticus]